MKYAWMEKHADEFPVAVMCGVLEVSPAAITRGETVT